VQGEAGTHTIPGVAGYLLAWFGPLPVAPRMRVPLHLGLTLERKSGSGARVMMMLGLFGFLFLAFLGGVWWACKTD